MKKNTYKWLAFLGAVVAIVLLIAFIIVKMNGETTATGRHQETTKEKTLQCYSNTFEYPYYSYDSATSHKTTINAIFSDDGLRNISLVYELNYNDAKSVSASESHNHASMNKSFAESNLGSDSFSAHYTKTDSKMSMSLFADGSDLKNVSTLKFFLVEDVSDRSSMKQFEESYKRQGFTCEEK